MSYFVSGDKIVGRLSLILGGALVVGAIMSPDSLGFIPRLVMSLTGIGYEFLGIMVFDRLLSEGGKNGAKAA